MMMISFLYCLATISSAQSIDPSVFEKPCFDGWAECFVEKKVRGVGFIYDHFQLRHNVHSRVSFLDLQPLPEKVHFIQKFPVIKKKAIEKNKIRTHTSTHTKTNTDLDKVLISNHDDKVLEAWNCGSIDQLEESSLQGLLSPEDVSCLETTLHKQKRVTQKVRISKILIMHMRQSKQKKKWERLLLRHLEKFDRSDANMSLGYAIFLVNKKEYIEAIKWSDHAIEQSHTFKKGVDTKQKRFQAYQLRAISANHLWKKYAEELIKYREDSDQHRIEKKKW